MTRLARLLALLVLLCLVGTACAGLPHSGPIEVGEPPADSGNDTGVPFAPRPPQRGESPNEIVTHFLEAMTANPIQVSVARQFLSSSARDAWKPERRMITYAGAPGLSGQTDVRVTLPGANWLDAHGAWRGPLPAREARFTLPLATEDGEWRITGAPDAMIVSDQWFQERFTQVSLYFFDSAAETLVPEPVFVPRGDQLATSLVRGLLQGPPEDMRGELRSFLPPDVRLADVSVPVENGVAEISLTGDLAGLAPGNIDPLAAQVAWTLRQDPNVSAVRITIGDSPVTLERGVSEFPVEEGLQFDPAGFDAPTDLFGLRHGRLVTSIPPDVLATDGALGRRDQGLRDVSVSLDGESAVGVTREGSTLLLAAVDGVSGRPARARAVLTRASDLLHPAWDLAGRLWLVDRTPRGARVMVRQGGRLHPVRVPGVTGKQVIDFLVSRDGTRLVAAVGRATDQRVVVSRLLATRSGLVGTSARTIARDIPGDGRIRDLGWRSPTDFVILSSLDRRLSEVHTLSVDGSTATPLGLPSSELLRSNAVRLLSAPVLDLPAWVVTAGGGFVQLSPVQPEIAPPRGLAVPTYVG